MQFGSVDGFLYVVRITGPTHNLLQLKLSTVPLAAPTCTEMRAAGGLDYGVRAEFDS
jgi:hypothetical protein